MAAPAVAQTAPPQFETFGQTWVVAVHPNSEGQLTDGRFKVDSDYCVSYGDAATDEFTASNVTFGRDSWGPNLNLIVRAGTHTAAACGGAVAYGAAEVASGPGWQPNPPAPPPYGSSVYGYGYYETLMKPSCVQGEVSSFFWVQSPSYGPAEIDVEFPNPPGHTFNDVHFTLHPSNATVDFTLPFSPCTTFHRYGFLWTPGTVVFTVDGKAAQALTDSTLNAAQVGFIMANAWTGHAAWGGGPPAVDAINTYRWFQFIPNATTIPLR